MTTLKALQQWASRQLWLDKLRKGLLFVTLFLCLQKLLAEVHGHYPIQHWLFWTHVRGWIVGVIFSIACFCSGSALLLALLRRSLPLREMATLAFPLGVLAFGTLSFIAGALQLYAPPTFIGIPLLLTAAGAPASFRYYRRAWLHLRHARARAPASGSPWSWLLAATGAVCVFLVYLPILAPNNIAYDARWYHLAIPEHYAVVGGVQRFVEGWYLGAYPHLASFLYVWPMLLPQQTPLQHASMAGHIEFAIFLWTLAGIPALVRRLLPGSRFPLSWVALFLFPKIFLYDSNLNSGADHVAALWAVPIFLTLLMVLRRWTIRGSLLLAALAAGAMLTKYTALIAVAFPLLAYAAASAARVLRSGDRARALREVATGVGLATAAGLALTSQHWLKNWIFYGDPLYPTLHRHLKTLRPWFPDAWVPFENYFLTTWSRPQRTWEGVKETLAATLNHSFIPNDWPAYHGKVPVFGSLFTLLLFCLPFLRRASRLWLLYASVHAGVFLWYWIHHFDRYLQTLVPLMSAAVCAAAVKIYRENRSIRAALVALFGAQIIWSLDVPAISSHVMIGGGSHFKEVLDLGAGGVKKTWGSRPNPFASYTEIGEGLPEDARILLHEIHARYGFRRPVISDWPGTQGGIHYASFSTAAQAAQKLKGMGVTHVVWRHLHSEGNDSPAGILMFFNLVEVYSANPKTVGAYTVAPLPEPPPEQASPRVAYFACHGGYKPGLYDLASLAISPHDARTHDQYPAPLEPRAGAASEQAILDKAQFAVINQNCDRSFPSPSSLSSFTLIANHTSNAYLARKKAP